MNIIPQLSGRQESALAIAIIVSDPMLLCYTDRNLPQGRR